MLDLPFNVLHELYRSAFLTAQAQAEKDKIEKQQREKEEQERRRQERRHNGNKRSRPVSSIPIKEQPMQMSSSLTPEEKRAQARANAILADGVEEIFEEGF